MKADIVTAAESVLVVIHSTRSCPGIPVSLRLCERERILIMEEIFKNEREREREREGGYLVHEMST